MSFQSPENQLKEAVAALGELKSLAETLKVSTEAKTQTDERLAKVEASIVVFGEQIEAMAAKLPAVLKKKIDAALDKEEEKQMEEEANELGGVNSTVISTKKKKKAPVAKEEEDEELMDEPVKIKSKKAAEAEDEEEDEEEMDPEASDGKIPPQFLKHIKKKKAADEEGEDEAELEEDAEKGDAEAKKAGVPPQFLKHMKKKMKGKPAGPVAAEGEDEAEEGEEADEAEEEMEEEEVKAKKVKAKKKAAEPVEDEEEEEEVEAKKAPAKKKAEEVAAPETQVAAVEAKASAEVFDPPMPANPVAEQTPAPVATAPVINAELESMKAELVAQAKSREDALASVSKMKAEFDSLIERISTHEKAEKSAEERVAKTIASLGVHPVASDAIASDDKPKTPEELAKEYQALEQSDTKEARRFWLKHADAIRSAAFGKSVRNFA